MSTRKSPRLKQMEENTSENRSSRTLTRQRSIFDIDDESQEFNNASIIETNLCLSESSDSDESIVTEHSKVIRDIVEEEEQGIKHPEIIKTEEVKPNDTELYDFSSILQSQKEISSLAEKLTQQVPIKSNVTKSSTRSTRKRKLDTNTHESYIETAGVEDLLKMGESKNIRSKSNKLEESDDDDEDGNFDTEERKTDDESLGNLETIQVTIQDPNTSNRSKKKECNRLEAELKRQLNLIKKKNQLVLHKTNIICLIASGRFINSILNTEDLLAVALSMIPSQKYYPPRKTTRSYVASLLSWFFNKMNPAKIDDTLTENLLEELLMDFEYGKASRNKYLVYLFIVTARVLGLQCRLVMNLCTVPIKPPLERAKSKKKKKNDESKQSEEVKHEEKLTKKKSSSNKRKVLSTSDEEEEELPHKVKTKRSIKHGTSKKLTKSKSKDKIQNLPTKRTTSKSKYLENVKEEDEDEDDEEEQESDKDLVSNVRKTKGLKKEFNNIWSEVYIEDEEKWISVDVVHNKINCDFQIYERCTSPVSYVLAWNSDGTIKDVTRRYIKQWHICEKSRVDPVWWNKTLKPWAPRKSKSNELEDKELKKKIEEMPMPTSILEFKNHPLYALKRHLLKFEAIYPPSAVPFGQIKGEDIYSRACVAELHTKEAWMKQAKVIKSGEEPYKIVKARPKREKGTGNMIKDLPLHLYGLWQVENYVPPEAVDGKVPRNEFGNVELYKPSMLPKGTVYLQLPGLMKIAKKLNIDCAPAVVGWEFSGGGSHPIFDGFIVCKEYKQKLLDAWNKEIENTEKKSTETRERRAVLNWKRFIRAIIVRNRLKVKYGFKFQDPSLKEEKE